LQVFVGPTYHQASQMIFAPTGLATAVPLVNLQTQAEGSVGVTQLISTTAPPQLALVFTISTPMATHAQGDFMTGFPAGWDPTTGLGMPPEFFIPSTVGQASSSVQRRNCTTQRGALELSFLCVLLGGKIDSADSG